MFITNDIKYVGVNDHDIDLFEGQYTVPNGMAYNSYLICDEHTAVMDSVDARFAEVWLSNIRAELDGKAPNWMAKPRTIWLYSTWSLTTPAASIFSCRPFPTPR